MHGAAPPRCAQVELTKWLYECTQPGSAPLARDDVAVGDEAWRGVLTRVLPRVAIQASRRSVGSRAALDRRVACTHARLLAPQGALTTGFGSDVPAWYEALTVDVNRGSKLANPVFAAICGVVEPM